MPGANTVVGLRPRYTGAMVWGIRDYNLARLPPLTILTKGGVG